MSKTFEEWMADNNDAIAKSVGQSLIRYSMTRGKIRFINPPSQGQGMTLSELLGDAETGDSAGQPDRSKS